MTPRLLLIRNTPPWTTTRSLIAFPPLAGFCHSSFLPCLLQGSPDLSIPGGRGGRGASPLQQRRVMLAVLAVPAVLAMPAGRLGASQK